MAQPLRHCLGSRLRHPWEISPDAAVVKLAISDTSQQGTVRVNLTGFDGCLDDCAIKVPLGLGCPIPPKTWGEFTYVLSPIPPTSVQGSAVPPTEDQLDPEFRIEQNQLFLPLIQAPGD